VRRATGRSLGARNGKRHGGLATPTGRTARAVRRGKLGRAGAPRTTAAKASRPARVSARRQIMQGARRGYATAKRVTRFTDPALTAKAIRGKPAPKLKASAAPKKPAGKAPAKGPAKGPKAAPGKPVAPPKNAAPRTASAPKAGAKPAAAKTAPKPGRPVTAPGRSKASTPMSSTGDIGVTAVTEAIRQHIGGFQPQHMIDIAGFLAGLDELLTTLGGSLSTVADRWATEEPLDTAVTEHLHQLAGHTGTLGEWARQTEQLFRMAHDTELTRLAAPRPNEQHWDVSGQ
jgi:hypothetical protein